MHDESRQADRVEEQVTPPTPVIYETVRRQGEQEMERPAVSLWWSGLAGCSSQPAGCAMPFGFANGSTATLMLWSSACRCGPSAGG